MASAEPTAGLRTTRLRGQFPPDPRQRDFFRAVIEERSRIRTAADLDAEQGARLSAFLKVLANSTSYGIYAEMNREELPGRSTKPVAVYGGQEPFTDPAVHAPETPGAVTFPPMAACITGAARLMLALLERLVTDRQGTYVFCDTDSMAIVATQDGSEIACPGGPDKLSDGRSAVRALTWKQVDEIQKPGPAQSSRVVHRPRGGAA